MGVKGDMAYANFMRGYNCCQSVVAAFASDMGMSEQLALRISCGLGGGVGRLRQTCGALCGVAVVLGTIYADPADPKDKSRIYAMVQQLAAEYKQKNGGGSIVCSELLARAGVSTAVGGSAEERTAAYYAKRPCPELCRLAADLCEQFLASHPEGRHC